MSTWNKIEKNFEKWLLIVSLVAMVLIIFAQVVLRWLGHPTVWAEELSRYIMLYQVWVGAAYAVREDAHIRITALVTRFEGEKRVRFEVFVLAIWLIFSIWLTVEGCSLVGKIHAMGQLSSAMQIPMTVPYASVPIGGLLMTARLVQKMAQMMKNKAVAAEEETEVL